MGVFAPSQQPHRSSITTIDPNIVSRRMIQPKMPEGQHSSILEGRRPNNLFLSDDEPFHPKKMDLRRSGDP